MMRTRISFDFIGVADDEGEDWFVGVGVVEASGVAVRVKEAAKEVIAGVCWLGDDFRGAGVDGGSLAGGGIGI
jgi:hypothetical protein